MAYVQFYFITMIFVLGGVWTVGTEAMLLTAEEGHELKIQCSHSYAIGNTKYFCKDPCDYKDVLITSNQVQRGKYSLKDKQNTFYVTISDLTVQDSGVYWCGVERVGKDTHNKVVITVKPRAVEISDSNASLQQASSSEKLLYIGSGLGALALLLAIVVVIFIKLRHRHRHSKPTAEEEESNVTYAKPFKSKQKPFQDTTVSCSSANQSSESETIQQERSMRLESTCDIYANVNQTDISIQSDTLYYSSISFKKHSPTATDTAHESTVYCEVKS